MVIPAFATPTNGRAFSTIIAKVKRVPGHRRRPVQPHESQQGWRQIGKPAVAKPCAIIRADKNHRHQICCVRRMR